LPTDHTATKLQGVADFLVARSRADFDWNNFFGAESIGYFE